MSFGQLLENLKVLSSFFVPLSYLALSSGFLDDSCRLTTTHSLSFHECGKTWDLKSCYIVVKSRLGGYGHVNSVSIFLCVKFGSKLPENYYTTCFVELEE